MARNADGKAGEGLPTQDEALSMIEDDFADLDGGAAGEILDDEEGDGAGGAVADDDGDAITVSEGEHLDDDEGDDAADDGDRGDGRRKDGTFAKKDGDADADAAAADKGGKAAAAADAGTQPVAGAADDEWKPFSVKADKAIVPIEGAFTKIVKGEGGAEFVVISVPKADAGRFTDRIARGHLFERRSREIEDYRSKLEKTIADIDRERELEKDAPTLKSDLEIEAEILIDAVQKKLAEDGGDFSSMFTPLELENMELRVAQAQGKAKADHTAARAKHIEEKQKPEREREAAETAERELQGQLITNVFEVLEDKQNHLTAEQKAAVAGMTEEQVKGALNSLLRLRRDATVGAIWKEADGYYVNSNVIFEALVNAKRSSAAAGGTRSPAPSTETTAAADGGKGGKGGSRDAADRFNGGVNSAPRPRSSSLRDKRDARPREERTTRERANAGGGQEERKPASMLSEDAWIAKQRKYLKSDSLDIEDDDEGED